jgi:hypothetical protein
LLRQLDLSMKSSEVSWVHFVEAGRALVTGEGGKAVHLWEATTGAHRATILAPRAFPRNSVGDWEVGSSPNGRVLFTANHGNLWAWDLDSRRAIGRFEMDEPHPLRALAGRMGVTSGPLAVSADGRLLAWSGPSRRTLLYEVCSGRIVHRFDGTFSSFAFAPSGWRLATGCVEDGSVLVWDLRALLLSPLPAAPVSPDALWANLAATEATRGYDALRRLLALPAADAFLGERLKPTTRLPPARLSALLADLASADETIRRRAEQGLAEARGGARAVLEEAQGKAKDLELRLRLARLLERLGPRSAESLREVRAVTVLELRATPEARRVLRRLAGGLAEANLTREAAAALARLGE